jgi:hypothetical protein
MSFLINPFAFAVAGGDYEAISSVTVGSGGAASMSFTSIPSTYQHLQLRLFYKNTGSVFMTLNTTNALKGHYLYGDGGVVAAGVSATNFIANASASQWGGAVVDILDYTSTSKLFTVRAFAGYDNNGSGELSINSELYDLSSTAVNAMALTPTSGNFAQYTTAALFGVKAP